MIVPESRFQQSFQLMFDSLLTSRLLLYCRESPDQEQRSWEFVVVGFLSMNMSSTEETKYDPIFHPDHHSADLTRSSSLSGADSEQGLRNSPSLL